jgi:3-oxoacyl-[acyl-carrier protein] reductase
VLVNNAGTTTFVPHDQLDALTEDIWLRTLRVNLVGAFIMSREAAPHIEAAGGGEIIMTSSIASTTANGSSIAYCASKAGMNSLTRTLAKTLGKKKIRVNAVLPGLIDGDWAFSTWGGGDPEQYEGLKKMFSDQTPLGHVVTPDDVADTILSLITGSDYVTGQLVTLDSGFTL